MKNKFNFLTSINCITCSTLDFGFCANNIGVFPITQYTHMRNKNSNTQGSSPNVVKEIFHTLNCITRSTLCNFIYMLVGLGDPMDIWREFSWNLIPQNDPKSTEPTWTIPHVVHHMTPNVKLFLLLRDPVPR